MKGNKKDFADKPRWFKVKKKLCPFEIIFDSIEGKNRDSLFKRKELMAKYLSILDNMPPEVKQVLTSQMGSFIVTPQESFVSYFKNAIPIYEPDVFAIKFVEIFNLHGERVIHDLIRRRNRRAGKSGNEEFWKYFEVLFYGMPRSPKKKEPMFARLKATVMSVWQLFKWTKRLILLS